MKRSLIILFLYTAMASCGGNKNTEPTGEEASAADETTVQLTDDQMKNAGIETGKLELKDISATLKVNGTIDVPPQNIVSVSIPLGGYLKSTKLLPGMHVSKGQPIAILEDPQYIQLQQDYLMTKAKLVYAQQEYNRQKELNQSKASSDKVLQQAQAELTSQNIMARSLAEKLRLININPERLTTETITRNISLYSPINGYVTKVNVNIGKYSNPSDVLFEIVNPADIHLALDIFEKDINKLSIGQKLLAYTNTNPSKKYPCEIILIGKDFSADRTVEVHAHFEAYDKTLIPGTYMNAEIGTTSNKVHVLPSDAIVTYENEQFVFVETGKNSFEITKVSTGVSQDNFTALSEASARELLDKKIVLRGAYNLLMKMKNISDE